MGFCDSSVVLSRLVEVSHSARAETWLADSSSPLAISSLVEVASPGSGSHV
jgi:hypothetical protein